MFVNNGSTMPSFTDDFLHEILITIVIMATYILTRREHCTLHAIKSTTSLIASIVTL